MGNFEQTQALTRTEVIDLLQSHGIIPTQQRIEIAQALFAKPQHLSAEQVMAVVNQERNLVSKATVYNTLGMFADKGLVREVIVDPNRVFYDSNTREHHHFFNVDTGTLTDIQADRVNLGDLPDLPPGTVADGVDVIIRVRAQRT
jgi:Fur family iron response transcriptional regulator